LKPFHFGTVDAMAAYNSGAKLLRGNLMLKSLLFIVNHQPEASHNY
jgi:hypothetical protein